jgi:DNA-binding response OmpR family regulator
LGSLTCDVRAVDNKSDALSALNENSFCFVLLDLEIKREPDSLKGHVEHGSSFLRELRQRHPEHAGRCYWLPVLIISGFAREVGTAVDVMKDGADDVIHKPFKSRDVSEAIRQVLERSGRADHASCGGNPASRVPDPAHGMVLSIPGDRVKRRTVVRLGTRAARLTDGSLKTLLRLVVGRFAEKPVHKRDLGANDDQGFRGISVLRDALKGALPEGVDIVENDHHGNYWLAKNVTLGDFNHAKIAEIGDQELTRLVREIERRASKERKV